MNSNDTIITEYVPKELFDIHIQNIRDKNASDEKLTDARFLALEKLLDERFNRLQAIVEKNLAEFKAENSDIRGELKAMATRTEGRIDTLSERIEHAIDTLSVAISNNNQRLDDFKNDIEHKQSAYAAKIGIFTALFIGAVQVVVSVVLHFWF